MAVPTERITEEKESRVMACGGWADETLIVHGKLRGREWWVNSGSLVDRLTVAFGQATGCALKAVQCAIDD